MSKDYAKNGGSQKPASKSTKQRLYWIVIIVLAVVFVLINYHSIKEKKAKLQAKEAVVKMAKRPAAKPSEHPVQFSFDKTKSDKK